MRKGCVRRVWSTEFNMLARINFNNSKLTPAEWVEQVTPVQACVDALIRGEWDMHDHWQPLIECVSRIESLLKLARMPANGFIDDIQAAFVTAMDRHKKTGSTAFKAAEIAMLRELVKVYGDLLGEVTHQNFLLATRHERANTARILSNRKKEAT